MTRGRGRREDVLPRRCAAILTALALAVAACSPSAGDRASPQSSAARPGTARRAPTPGKTSARPGAGRLRVIGHSALGGRGFNADVYGFRRFAYVGVWGGVFENAPCPATGVKVVDLKRPRRPKLVGVLQNPSGTTAEDVVVRHVETPFFSGDVAAVGIQPCGFAAGAFRGLQFFDVTRPARARELGRWQAPPGTIGCHEIDLAVGRGGRVLAGCANSLAARRGHDEAVIVDASDPSNPREVGGWRSPSHWSSGTGCSRLSVAHSVRFFNQARHLYVSYWDAGTILLDIRNPARPKRIGTARTSAHSKDGDHHSMTLADDDLLLVTVEDFSPASPDAVFEGCGGGFGAWGHLYIFDNSKPSRPRLLAAFGTPHARTKRSESGAAYTVHNSEVVRRDQVFASWFSDGVRWVDISKPRRPQEIARFVPPRTRDPHGFFPPVTLVWGVKPLQEMNLILASDINSGLWILRAEGLGDF